MSATLESLVGTTGSEVWKGIDELEVATEVNSEAAGLVTSGVAFRAELETFEDEVITTTE
jgi:hypothetical protein